MHLSCVIQTVADLPVWVSFTLEDSLEARLRSGESLMESVWKLMETVAVDAVLVNCSAPATCSAALKRLQEVTQTHSGHSLAPLFISEATSFLQKSALDAMRMDLRLPPLSGSGTSQN